MIASVAKWGNSLALRIPTAFARELGVREGISVDISVANGALLVRPVEETHVYDLEALLCEITEDNQHGEIATGRAVGNEF
jgi:antitoxin MazE